MGLLPEGGVVQGQTSNVENPGRRGPQAKQGPAAAREGGHIEIGSPASWDGAEVIGEDVT